MSVELRPCRQGWMFCDGDCAKCITIATSTTTTNPEKIENCGTKHGRWIVISEYPKKAECSYCGYPIEHELVCWWDYCPNCGARLDEVEE